MLPSISQHQVGSSIDSLTKDFVPELALRLTHNTVYLLKDYMINGVVLPAMSSMLSALKKFNQDFDHETILTLFVRDVHVLSD